MNTLFLNFIADMPTWVLLLSKTTLILSLAWCGHFALASANPRWRVFLWRITGVSLVILAVLAMFAPRLALRMELAARAVPARLTTYTTTNAPLHQINGSDVKGRVEHVPPGNLVSKDPVSESRTNSSGSPAAQAFDLGALAKRWRATVLTLIVSVWLAGITLRGFRLCSGHLLIRRVLRLSRQAPESIQDECRHVSQAIRCRRRVAVHKSESISSPLVCGLRTSILLLPQRMCRDSYRGELPGIVAHELAHIGSFDVVWNELMELLSIVLWFHPLAWRMRKVHLDACELVCDAVSASYVGNVNDYCRTLARVAIDINGSIPAAGIAMARTSLVTRRLQTLKERFFPMPLRRRRVITVAVMTLLAARYLAAIHITQAAPPDAPTVKAAAENTTPEPASVRVRVLDPDGKPLPEASIHASMWTNEKGFKASREYTTDADGFARVQLPRSYYIVRFWGGKKPYVTMFSHWETEELAGNKKLPAEYTIRLERGVKASGRIVDEHGNPIAGAKVKVHTNGGTPIKGDGRTSYDIDDDVATTDADGRWQIDNVPASAQAKLSLLVTHPDYSSDETWQQSQKESGVTTKMLLQGVATVTLKVGNIVHGRVTDPTSHPIKDAIVVLGDEPYDSNVPAKFPTDADGRFRLPAQASKLTSLTVIAPGFAPQLRRIEMKKGLPSQDFKMEPGKLAEIRFVDASGKPVPNVFANLLSWKGSKSVFYQTNPNHPKVPPTKIPNKAGANGVWRWNSAPDDPVTLEVYAKGFARIETTIAGGEPPKTVTLRSEHRITGHVIDAETKQPILAFAVIPIDVFRPDWLVSERFNAKTGKDGKLDYLPTRTDIPQRLRIEAMGYRTQTGPEFRVGDDSPRVQDFALQSSKLVTGQVINGSGKPVANAEVLLATPTAPASIQPDASGSYKVITDSAGRFAFADPGELLTLIAQSDAGFAVADFPEGAHDIGTLQLRPWATIRGQFREGGQPVPHATIFVQPIRLDNLILPRIETRLETETDSEGRFEFVRVPPGRVSVRVWASWPWQDDDKFHSAPSAPLDLQPGQHVDLDLGGAGATLRGRIKLVGNVPSGLNCHWSINYLIRREPGVKPPESISRSGFDIRKGWQPKWLSTHEGETYLTTLQHWHVQLAPDGTFRIDGVPPGDYDLAVRIYAKPEGCMVDPLAQKVERVTVTADDLKRGALTLPDISAPVVPVPVAGDVPKLNFEREDGSPGTLEEFRGQPVIVHFWASWCGPCREQLPAVRKLHDELVSAKQAAFVSVSVDDDTATWRSALKEHNMPWTQGRLTTEATAGVSSVPAYWLLDPSGKILAKSGNIDEIRQRLSELHK
jgi:beta-lactamase regulating signal transducer with metallopeptidase domain/thiol-disulfide isomerase/thioredoxin/protocatechuate 3,4-dioxygenase beta subunit